MNTGLISALPLPLNLHSIHQTKWEGIWKCIHIIQVSIIHPRNRINRWCHNITYLSVYESLKKVINMDRQRNTYIPSKVCMPSHLDQSKGVLCKYFVHMCLFSLKYEGFAHLALQDGLCLRWNFIHKCMNLQEHNQHSLQPDKKPLTVQSSCQWSLPSIWSLS